MKLQLTTFITLGFVMTQPALASQDKDDPFSPKKMEEIKKIRQEAEKTFSDPKLLQGVRAHNARGAKKSMVMNQIAAQQTSQKNATIAEKKKDCPAIYTVAVNKVKSLGIQNFNQPETLDTQDAQVTLKAFAANLQEWQKSLLSSPEPGNNLEKNKKLAALQMVYQAIRTCTQ